MILAVSCFLGGFFWMIKRQSPLRIWNISKICVYVFMFLGSLSTFAKNKNNDDNVLMHTHTAGWS